MDSKTSWPGEGRYAAPKSAMVCFRTCCMRSSDTSSACAKGPTGIRHAGGVLDQGGQNTLSEHRQTFVDEGRKHAAGVKASTVVDHNRRLADSLRKVHFPSEAFIRRFLAAN